MSEIYGIRTAFGGQSRRFPRVPGAILLTVTPLG